MARGKAPSSFLPGVFVSSVHNPRKLRQIQRLQSLLQHRQYRCFSSSTTSGLASNQLAKKRLNFFSSYTTVVSSHSPDKRATSSSSSSSPLTSSASTTQNPATGAGPLTKSEEDNPSISSQSDTSNEYTSSSKSPASSSSLHGSSSPGASSEASSPPPSFSIPSQQEGDDPTSLAPFGGGGGEASRSGGTVREDSSSSSGGKRRGGKYSSSFLYGARSPKEASERANESIEYANEEAKTFPGALASATATSVGEAAQAAQDLRADAPASSKGGGGGGNTFTLLASLGLLGGGLGLLAWGLGGGVFLLTQESQPLQVTWDFLKNDPRVKKEMGEDFQRERWWGGYERSDSARVKLRLKGRNGERGLAVCDLAKESSEGPWKILLLNFLRIDNKPGLAKDTSNDQNSTDQEKLGEVMKHAISLHPPQPDRKTQAQNFSSGNPVSNSGLTGTPPDGTPPRRTSRAAEEDRDRHDHDEHDQHHHDHHQRAEGEGERKFDWSSGGKALLQTGTPQSSWSSSSSSQSRQQQEEEGKGKKPPHEDEGKHHDKTKKNSGVSTHKDEAEKKEKERGPDLIAKQTDDQSSMSAPSSAGLYSPKKTPGHPWSSSSARAPSHGGPLAVHRDLPPSETPEIAVIGKEEKADNGGGVMGKGAEKPQNPPLSSPRFEEKYADKPHEKVEVVRRGEYESNRSSP